MAGKEDDTPTKKGRIFEFKQHEFIKQRRLTPSIRNLNLHKRRTEKNNSRRAHPLPKITTVTNVLIQRKRNVAANSPKIPC